MFCIFVSEVKPKVIFLFCFWLPRRVQTIHTESRMDRKKRSLRAYTHLHLHHWFFCILWPCTRPVVTVYKVALHHSAISLVFPRGIFSEKATRTGRSYTRNERESESRDHIIGNWLFYGPWTQGATPVIVKKAERRAATAWWTGRRRPRNLGANSRHVNWPLMERACDNIISPHSSINFRRMSIEEQEETRRARRLSKSDFLIIQFHVHSLERWRVL